MKSTWMTAALGALLALPIMASLGGCFHDHHRDRDDRGRDARRYDHDDKDRRGEHHDVDIRIEGRRN